MKTSQRNKQDIDRDCKNALFARKFCGTGQIIPINGGITVLKLTSWEYNDIYEIS